MDSASAMENKSRPEPSGDQLHSTDYAPYPKLDPADVAPPPPPPPAAAARSGGGGDYEATTMPAESNPYVTPAPAAASSSSKYTIETVKDVLGRWGKNVGEAAKKTEDLAGNVWQHHISLECLYE